VSASLTICWASPGANQPLFATTLSPPIGARLAGACVSLALIGSPANVAARTASGDSLPSRAGDPERSGRLLGWKNP
jgi:hypothetical protein